MDRRRSSSSSSTSSASSMAARLAEFKMDGLGGAGTLAAASRTGLDPSVDPESLTPEDYMERFGITAYLREAINLVLENRPQAPVEFLGEYFRNAVQGSSYLHRAYRFVRMTDRDRPGFVGNVVKAHRVLARRKGSIGVTGEEMDKLLRLLCHDLPPTVSEAVLGTLLKRHADPGEIIEFDTFFLSIKVCLLFEEQVEFAQQYFESLCIADDARDRGGGRQSGSPAG